jgi:hypothetical protein
MPRRSITISEIIYCAVLFHCWSSSNDRQLFWEEHSLRRSFCAGIACGRTRHISSPVSHSTPAKSY